MYSSQDLLQQLAALLTQSGYTERSREDLEQEAARTTRSSYDQKRLSTQQAYERQLQALAQELTTLADSYHQERAQSAAAYQNSYGQWSRDAQKRGLQRSSYAADSLANLLTRAAQAQGEIASRQTAAEQELQSRKTLAGDQYSEQLRRYDEQQQADTQAALDTLLRQEQENRDTALQRQANQLLQLYQSQMQQEQNAQAQSNWLAEFNAKYGTATAGKKSGGSSAKQSTVRSTRSTRSAVRHSVTV